MPNIAEQTNQRDAELQMYEFVPLIRTKCSPWLKFFLCSVYFPFCTEQVDETLIIPPCRSMCLGVKENCEPILHQVSLKWPDVLDCGKLPEKNDRYSNLCIEPPLGYHDKKDFKCPPRYTNVEIMIRGMSNDTCAPRCQVDVMYRFTDKKFAEIWMILWAVLCLVSTLFTFLTFILDTTRFEYPERPIIYLSMCCLVYSCGYIIRFARGLSDVSCIESRHQVSYVIQEGLENTWCVVVFLILYYFNMAGCIWWVILTSTFYFSAAKKWSREALQKANNYFHVISWTLPAVLTTIVLTMRRLDGDELTGLCFVGNQDMDSLLTFVLFPNMVFLIIGVYFIIGGFVAMFRIRQDLVSDGCLDVKKFEKLMMKIGIFSILYTLPDICVVGCLFFEWLNFRDWRAAAYLTPCYKFDDSLNHQQLVDCSLEKSIPAVEVKVLKIFMSLVIGTASGIWVWSPKTVQLWTKFFKKFCPGKSNENCNRPRIYKKNSFSKVSTNAKSTSSVLQSNRLVGAEIV
ncbi:hypothetical protein HELRODRAFT_95849 [Helobdella robusta]|uniref:Frizzled-4 n=1 Tax=Helobdella robusta TaxID=6412 RepID=T1G984_HELRO|nr:hypothetical protein HELRODRAFT_95849 [Helobdella robusta]ESN94705.1 hypothetical protein HELRODRAFT_95849 [Helobdella robusta]